MVSLLYLCLSALGLGTLYFKYEAFGIDVLEYFDATDYLTASFRHTGLIPILAFVSVVMIGGYSGLSYLNGPLFRNYWSRLVLSAMAVGVVALYLVSMPYKAARGARLIQMHNVMVTTKGTPPEVIRGYLIGKSQDYFFLSNRSDSTVIPVSNIATVIYMPGSPWDPIPVDATTPDPLDVKQESPPSVPDPDVEEPQD